jgi:hypothetical protein
MGSAQNRVRHSINETSANRGGRGQDRGGYGRGGRGGRTSGRSGRGGQPRQSQTDSRIITLTNGSQIEYHASF